MDKNNGLIVTLIALVIGGALGYFGATLSAPKVSPEDHGGMMSMMAMMKEGGMMMKEMGKNMMDEGSMMSEMSKANNDAAMVERGEKMMQNGKMMQEKGGSMMMEVDKMM